MGDIELVLGLRLQPSIQADEGEIVRGDEGEIVRDAERTMAPTPVG